LRHRAARDHAKKTAFLAWLLLLLAVVAALLPSCGTRNKAGEVAGGFVQTGAGMTVELRVDPFPPKAMQKATFTIAVTGVDGLPVSGATVFCNMTMPEMDMPLNRDASGDLLGRRSLHHGRQMAGGPGDHPRRWPDGHLRVRHVHQIAIPVRRPQCL
jgi:hypothetical protein